MIQLLRRYMQSIKRFLTVHHATAGKDEIFVDPRTNTTTRAPNMENSTWFMAGCVVLATVLILFFRTNYKRLEACPLPLRISSCHTGGV